VRLEAVAAQDALDLGGGRFPHPLRPGVDRHLAGTRQGAGGPLEHLAAISFTRPRSFPGSTVKTVESALSYARVSDSSFQGSRSCASTTGTGAALARRHAAATGSGSKASTRAAPAAAAASADSPMFEPMSSTTSPGSTTTAGGCE
jgi:hypothetical protein